MSRWSGAQGPLQWTPVQERTGISVCIVFYMVDTGRYEVWVQNSPFMTIFWIDGFRSMGLQGTLASQASDIQEHVCTHCTRTSGVRHAQASPPQLSRNVRKHVLLCSGGAF